ncbi:MAG TPA: adenylate/guanylate cyclase domain-containing protein [Dongiaceae bacterium]
MERRLTTILAADVVGYSRLMEADEAGTLAVLKSRRKEVLEPLVTKHKGRIFKVTGDGVLVEFASTVNAVQCAIDLQQAFAAANGDTPEERQIALRIGVNLGDVMVEGSDLYGDGVNIAARLESMAEPGGVLVASSAYDHVTNKVGTRFDDLGLQDLKNIAKPIRVYRADLTYQPRPISATGGTSKERAQPEKTSIAVLPFVNMSGDPTQDYFCDGITADIITELARYRSLSVIARNSSFQFRGSAVDLPAVRHRLGVRYIVEGSIRRAGYTIRVSAQLIDAATGVHLWAERYDRMIEEVFAVQDEMVHSIASTLEGRLAAAGAAQARAKPTASWAAYDYFLQGRECVVRNRMDEADSFLARAIELDPDFARAYALRSGSLIAKYWRDGKQETLRQAVTCAEKALSLDESDAWSHGAMGYVSLYSKKLALAGMHYEKAMSTNPNDVYIITDYANWLSHMGRLEEALTYLDLAMQRDPFPPSWTWEVRGITLILAKRYEEAISALQKVPIEDDTTHALLAAAYAWAGQFGKARREIALAREGNPDLTIAFFRDSPYADETHLDHILGGLRMAGLPE